MYIENVSSLDKSSFNERELYDELFSIEDEFDRQRVINTLREKAKKEDALKPFDENVQAYKRALRSVVDAEKKRSQLEVPKHITDFPMLDDTHQLYCGEWQCNSNGIICETDKGYKIACTHPIWITRLLRNNESGKYKVEIEFFIRNKLRTICVDREVISSPSKILQLANDSVQVNALSAPYLVQYLADIEALNPDMIEEYASTSRLGWTDSTDNEGNIKKIFLPYQQSVVFDNELATRSLFDSIHPNGSRDKWFALIKDIRTKGQIEVLINLAASFASVLVDPVGALPFIVSLWGGTGIGKSVILKICTSVWADPGEGKYITDAKATNVAMEVRLNILNSLPMTLDDMAQIKTQVDGDFSDFIYRWCAGKGRDRSNKDLGLNKLTSWRNCTITNGEHSLIDERTQGGAVNRVIDIEASGEVLFDGRSGNRVVKCVEKNFGYAGQEFVEVVNQIGFDAVNKIYQEQYNRIKELTDQIGEEKEEKQIVPMALILAADYLTEKYLFQDGITLDIRKCVSFLKNKDAVSENERAYEYLLNTIAQNRFKFADNVDENVNASEIWGFFKDKDKLVINGNIFDRIIRDGKYEPGSFLSWCKKKGIIETDRDRLKKTVKFKGNTFKAVVIDLTYGSDENADFTDVSDEIPFD